MTQQGGPSGPVSEGAAEGTLGSAPQGQTSPQQEPTATRATRLAPKRVPSIGRIVHYKLDEGPNKGRVRAAMVVDVLKADGDGDDAVELQIYPGHRDELTTTSRQICNQGDGDGQWQWPPVV